MDQTSIETVRRFNRALTRRIGVLDDSYLGADGRSARPGCCSRSALTGATSRACATGWGSIRAISAGFLRCSAEQGLVEIGADPDDGRRRRAVLTETGLEEWRAYDSLSDDFARSLLSPLDDDQRRRLVTAMAEVERLIAWPAVELVSPVPGRRGSQGLPGELFRRTGKSLRGGLRRREKPAARGPATQPPLTFLLARIEGRTGGLRRLYDLDAKTGEIKRMWVAPDARGLGIARRLLEALEKRPAPRA
jgi:GNAT superfamily N-acetyltransferase